MDLHIQGNLDVCGHEQITYCWLDGEKYYGEYYK